MKFSVTQAFPKPAQEVYAALIDPNVIRSCIDGCEKLTPTGVDAWDAEMRVGISVIKGRYAGKVRIAEKNPPNSFALHMEGKGTPGFLKGIARMQLHEANGQTSVRCDCDAQVGGLIAAVGSRLIEAAAKRMMQDFFQKLRSQLSV